MAQKIIQIPRINDGPEDFAKLFDIWNQGNDYFEDIYFEFAGCDFLRPNAVAFLGGLARLIESRHGRVAFKWDTLYNSWVKTTICQNGFAGSFGHPSARWDGTSIPYREHKERRPDDIMDFLEHYWIGKGWIHISPKLMNAIVGHMWEIYNNAFEHSGTEIGVFSCGQYFKRQNDLVLSIVDFGQGIPASIRNFLNLDPRAQDLRATACLRWAFQAGNTTKKDEVGGSGLDLLKQFIILNQGKLEVYSNEGYAIIDKNGEKYESRDISFEGTVIHITLRCDESLYCFSGETVPPF